MFRSVIVSAFILAALGGCQSGPGASVASRPALAPRAAAAPLSDAEMEQALAAAERAGAMAPAVGAAGIVGGFDPTGLLQTTVNAEAERRMVDLQRYLPGMMARNRQDTDRMCAGQPTQPELAEACRQLAEAKAQLAAEGVAVPVGR